MIFQQITGPQPWSAADWAIRSQTRDVNSVKSFPARSSNPQLSLFFFYTYHFLDGCGGSGCLALVVLQPGSFFILRHGFQA